MTRPRDRARPARGRRCVAGCGWLELVVLPVDSPSNPNANEVSPPGDIPDNQAYVAYSPPGAGYSVKVPEGWARSTRGRRRDVHRQAQLDPHGVGARRRRRRPSRASERELPQLAKSVDGFQPAGVTIVKRTAGPAVRDHLPRAAPPDPVTGKTRHRRGRALRLLPQRQARSCSRSSGPKGADNVDPWRLVTDSLRWSR